MPVWFVTSGMWKDIFALGVPLLEKILDLLTRNRIFVDRTEGIGVISKEDAISYGCTGPTARASGLNRNLETPESIRIGENTMQMLSVPTNAGIAI